MGAAIQNYNTKRRAAAQPNAFSLLSKNALTYGIWIIFLSDLFKEFAAISAPVKLITYSMTITGVALMVAYCFRTIGTSPRSLAVTAATYAFCAVLIVWAIIWLVKGDADPGVALGGNKWITFGANPSYSFSSWLIILVIPASALAKRSDVIFTNNMRLLWILPLFMLATLPINIHGCRIYAPAIVIAIFFIASTTHANYALKMLALACCLIAMSYLGYRTYIISTVLLAGLLSIGRLGRLSVLAFICFCAILPVAYYEFFGGLRLDRLMPGSKVFTDTRTFLFDEMMSGMSAQDLFLGRGIDGKYFSRYFYNWSGLNTGVIGDYYYRSGAEVGWLNVILKFGLLGLILNLISYLTPLVRYLTSPLQNSDTRYVKFCLVLLFVYTGELPHAADLGNTLWMAALGGLLRAPKRHVTLPLRARDASASSIVGTDVQRQR